MRSLRTKISLLTLCITVVAVAVVTLTSVLFIQNTERRKSDQLLLLLCETGERNLDYYFTSVEKSVKKMASYTEKDLDGLEDEQLEAHTERVKAYFDQIAGKTNGVLTYYYRIDPEVSRKAKGFWFTNLDGTDFVEHEPTDITKYDTNDTSQLVWFTVPKATGNGVWLPPYLTDSLDNVRVISYNVPIYYRGQFVGVIGIEIDHSTMAEQVSSIKLYSDGYAFLTDANGDLIYHPRIDLATLPDENRPKLPEGVMSESTFTEYTFDGTEKEAAWLKLSNGMRLYVSVPKGETEGDWQKLITRVLIVAAETADRGREEDGRGRLRLHAGLQRERRGRRADEDLQAHGGPHEGAYQRPEQAGVCGCADLRAEQGGLRELHRRNAGQDRRGRGKAGIRHRRV